MTYTPEFEIRDRNGLASLWVKMPSGDCLNIWDLDNKNLSFDTLDAIKSAFNRGFEAQRQLIQEATFHCISRGEWEDKRSQS